MILELFYFNNFKSIVYVLQDPDIDRFIFDYFLFVSQKLKIDVCF